MRNASRLFAHILTGAERTAGRAAHLNEERGFLGSGEVAMRAGELGKSIDEVLADERR
jgi:hypothetical protein